MKRLRFSWLLAALLAVTAAAARGGSVPAVDSLFRAAAYPPVVASPVVVTRCAAPRRTLPEPVTLPGRAAPRPPLDRRLHRGYEGWNRVVPTQGKIQYAGSIGFLSFGAGWDYGRRCQWETDAILGFLPEYESDAPKITFTLKQSYIPWSIACGGRWSVEPFSCGAFLTTILSDKFWVKQPDRYPSGYYSLSTRIRAHLFVGQRITLRTSLRRVRRVRSLTLFYELNTCDIYLISKITNRTLDLGDMLSLSFGLKFQFL